MLHFESLRHMPTVKVAMTTFPYSIDIDATLADAWAMMLEHDVRHLPVTENDALVGILTERDLRLVLHPGSAATAGTVRLACTMDPFVVNDDTRLDVVAREMAERQIGSVLIERHGKLVGILTTTDVCRLLVGLLEARFPDGSDDGDEPAA
jgi:CBS domain-containing protein